MSRLRHSEAGYLRSMQISKTKMFVFVEGKEADPFFYGKICNDVCNKVGIDYQIRLAKQLPDASGGKSALIKFFRYLKSKGALFSRFNEKNTCSIFYLDKDVDDILKTKLRSPHAVYTDYYDVQNYIFCYSNFKVGIAAAASLDPTMIDSQPIFNSWHKHAALRWKEWVTLCLLCQKYKINSVANYSSTSQINVPLNGSIHDGKFSEFLVKVEAAYNGPNSEFQEVRRKISLLVNKIYDAGDHDKIFKGKWYATLLESDLRDLYKGVPFHCEKFSQRISCVLASTLNFTEAWTNKFKLPLHTLALEIISEK